MLCSDGLCGFVEDESLQKIIEKTYKPEGTDLNELAENLVKAAYLNGGADNISVCLYQHL
jgi:serine/threonine protein phosphatase PrpC